VNIHLLGAKLKIYLSEIGLTTTVRITVSIDNNDGLFDKIKKVVDAGYTIDPVGQEQEFAQQKTAVGYSADELEQFVEHQLLNRLSSEKHRLSAELELKFKEASIKRLKSQEQKFKQILLQEKQRYQKQLKEKYEGAVKTILQRNEQKISDKYKQQHYTTEIELRHRIKELEMELSRQQENLAQQLTAVKYDAKNEQENASRALYEERLQKKCMEVEQQVQQRLREEFAKREMELHNEHERILQKQTAELIESYEQRLRAGLLEQERFLTQDNSQKLNKQSEALAHRMQQEIAVAVADTTNRLQAEFAIEKQTLHAIIENMRPEVENNRVRMHIELEQEIRQEFAIKYEEFKQKTVQESLVMLEVQLTTEKQKLAEKLQEENSVVLKYKEREIREKCQTEYTQQLQDKLQLELQEQLQSITAAHKLEIEQLTDKLNSEHMVQLQAEIIQERAKVADQNTHEKKILLQQQQESLQIKFNADLTNQLSEQAKKLAHEYADKISMLEEKMQTMQKARQMQDILVQNSMVSQTPSAQIVDANEFARQKQEALQEQKKMLLEEFSQTLQKARADWELERRNTLADGSKQDLIACEKKLRLEFQEILVEQRRQAAINFAKQRDREIHAALSKYKQKLLKEWETKKVNDLAAMEDALQEQYNARVQQQSELAKVEVQRAKEQIILEQQEKFQHSLEQQSAKIRVEYEDRFSEYVQDQEAKMQKLLDDERKNIAIKFATDKASLIKELTARFNREKHEAMNRYETELRDKLYKEMVKQKEFIQSKFASTQESALNEQRRRLDAQHKQELERIKQGYFDPNPNYQQREEIVAERNIEQMADRILSKFQRDT